MRGASVTMTTRRHPLDGRVPCLNRHLRQTHVAPDMGMGGQVMLAPSTLHNICMHLDAPFC